MNAQQPDSHPMWQSGDWRNPDVVAESITSGSLGDLVRASLANPEWVASVARQSYEHWNGFLKVVLWSGVDGSRLVWHSWPDRAAGRDPEAHNHRWNFTSFVLSGLMVDHRFREELGTDYAKYIYRSTGGARTYDLTYRGPATLEAVRSTETRAGQSYDSPHLEVHKAEPEPGTNTLVVQEPPSSITTDVFVNGSGVPVQRRRVTGVEPSELGPRLAPLLRVLEG